MRRGAKTGRKVVYVWDKASIDMRLWYSWKQGSGIYFVSLAKDNMKTEEGRAHREWDRDDPVNRGVTADFLWLGTSTGVAMRVVEYTDPATGKVLSFITSITASDVPPGVIAQLYRMRWDIEKVFDEVKNSIDENKAWASAPEAKIAQANFICLTHNLMRILEHDIEANHGIKNDAELRRAAGRMEELRIELGKSRGKLRDLYEKLVRTTKISVKFIRWLRSLLTPKPSEQDPLHALYEHL